jgi:hypothetical protein
MQRYAAKASGSAKKGGVLNLLFVIANADSLPNELDGLVSDITIWFPWGSLLRAAVTADEKFLFGLKRIATKDASLRILFSLENDIEKRLMERLGIKSLNNESLNILKAAYARSGLHINWREIAQKELKSFPSTWAKRLAYGRPRVVVELTGKVH